MKLGDCFAPLAMTTLGTFYEFVIFDIWISFEL